MKQLAALKYPFTVNKMEKMEVDIALILKTFIVEELLSGEVELDNDDNLLADGMVDSLGMLRLVSHIEAELNIKIPHSDLVIETFRTIETITHYLEQRLAN